MNIIETKTLGEAWIKAMEMVLGDGQWINDDDVKLKEIRNLYVHIDSINDQDTILQKYADQKRIALMKEKYSTCGLVGDYKIDYGSYIYNNNGINQVDWLIDRIRNKPETKSATITLHKPGEKMLACLSMLDFKLRDNRLDMSAVYRSQNVFWSQPGNMLALRHIQEDVATALNCQCGVVDLVVFSAHIYEYDVDKANNILDDLKKQ